MSSFFENYGTKPVLRSEEIFNPEGGKPELLYEFYQNEPEISEEDFKKLDKMYWEWIRSLFFGNYNIIIQQSSSCFPLLCQFYESYLASNQIPDYLSADDEKATLDIVTVMLHGRVSLSEEEFCGSLVKRLNASNKDSDIEEEVITTTATSESLDNFIEHVKSNKIHYIFIVHSLELLYLDSNPVFNIIFHKLIEEGGENIHFIASMNLVAGIKIFDKGQAFYRYILYNCDKYGRSFLYEKAQALVLPTEDDCDAIGSKKSKVGKAFVRKDKLDFKTLKSVYEAVQKDCLKILVFILEYFVDRSKRNYEDLIESKRSLKFGDAHSGPTNSTSPGDDKNEFEDRRMTRSGRAGGSRGATGQSTQVVLSFDCLLDFYAKINVVRRKDVVRNYLDELIDHKIIKFDETGSKIICLVDIATGKKFLDYLQAMEQGS